MSLTPEHTIRYKTYLKSTIRSGLADVFAHHPDLLLKTDAPTTKGVNVTLEFPKKKNNYPAVVIRFSEGDIKNFGVGHEELIRVNGTDLAPTRFSHYLYDGSLEFVIYALSNLDRDIMADSVVQTLTMPTLQGYTQRFYDALYNATTPDSKLNFINLDTDTLTPGGDQELPVPWGSEDDKLYQSSYRIKVFGEFYSPINTTQTGGYVEEVDVLPYIQDLETEPTGRNDTAEWV